MIRYKMRKRGGFNWARDLYEIQKAINDIPKAVIANRSPLEFTLKEETRPSAKKSERHPLEPTSA